MNALIRFRLHVLAKRRAAAAEPATPESIRARRIALDHELVIDDDTHTPRITPRVLCDRRLDGWRPIAKTLYRAVIR